MRSGVLVPSALGAQRVFQYISLPLKNARLTPASRAASTLSRCVWDQYSSWPLEMNVLWLRSRLPRRWVSTLAGVADVVAVALEEADHRVLRPENSHERPPSSSAVLNGRL